QTANRRDRLAINANVTLHWRPPTAIVDGRIMDEHGVLGGQTRVESKDQRSKNRNRLTHRSGFNQLPYGSKSKRLKSTSFVRRLLAPETHPQNAAPGLRPLRLSACNIRQYRHASLRLSDIRCGLVPDSTG